MKIVQIGSYPLNSSLIKGGVEASVFGLAQEQAKSHQIYIFDIPRQDIAEDKKEIINNIEIFRYANNKAANNGALLRIFSIVKEIKEINPEICHIHGSNPFSFVLLLALRHNKIKSVITIHGLSHIEKKNQWKNNRSIRFFFKYLYFSICEFLLLNFSSKIIVDTEYVKTEIEKYRKQRKIRKVPECVIIPQGINDSYFQIGKNETPEVSLLSVGAINERKGHLYLIEAMSIIHKNNPEIKLYIVGVKNDEKYYYKLCEKIKAKQLDNVVFLKPDISFTELLTYYSQTTMFVLHSQEESQGIVFCEAMAAGKAVVATNVGGVPWVIKHKKNGLLCNFEDTSAFAENIMYLLENKLERGKIEHINNLESIKYNWKTISEEIIKIYISIK